LSYKLDISEDALSKLEDFGMSDSKILRQVFIKILSLRRNPKPQDCKVLQNFTYAGFKGCRVDQGEYRIICAVDEKNKTVKVGHILNRNEDYKELKHKK
jgi:mRNA-degrading endonuclease RelE of RelBE toxin-antitoxin system